LGWSPGFEPIPFFFFNHYLQITWETRKSAAKHVKPNVGRTPDLTSTAIPNFTTQPRGQPCRRISILNNQIMGTESFEQKLTGQKIKLRRRALPTLEPPDHHHPPLTITFILQPFKLPPPITTNCIFQSGLFGS